MEMCCTHEEHSCRPSFSDTISFDFPHPLGFDTGILERHQAVQMIPIGGHTLTWPFSFILHLAWQTRPNTGAAKS